MECRDVLKDLITYMGHLHFAQVSVKGWIIDPDKHSSLMILAVLCASLPPMEKLSTLMQCLEVLPCLYGNVPMGCQPPFGTVSLPFTCSGAIYGKYGLVSMMFSLRHDEAMFYLPWQKLVCDNQNILLKQYKEFYNENWIKNRMRTFIYKPNCNFNFQCYTHICNNNKYVTQVPKIYHISQLVYINI